MERKIGERKGSTHRLRAALKERLKRIGRNSKTRGAIPISAEKTPVFRAGKVLNAAIDKSHR